MGQLPHVCSYRRAVIGQVNGQSATTPRGGAIDRSHLSKPFHGPIDCRARRISFIIAIEDWEKEIAGHDSSGGI